MRGTIKVRSPNRRALKELGDRLGDLQYVEGVSTVEVVPPLPPAYVARPDYVQGAYRERVYFTLEIQNDGGIVITGSKLAGLNIQTDGVDVITDGTLAITVLSDGA